MNKISKLLTFTVLILSCFAFSFATQEQIRIDIQEYADQNILYNPLKTGDGIWFDPNENQSNYVITGYLIVSNNNPNGKTMSVIICSLNNTRNITMTSLLVGRNGTFVSNNPSTGNLILHIPELESGENSTWVYSVNTTNIRPPLNFTTSYSDSKLLAGDNITVTDIIENRFDNLSYQTNNCIYDINITQNTVPIDFGGIPQDYFYIPASIAGTDSSNVTFTNANKSLNWDVNAGGCLNKSSITDINYVVSTPLNIPKTTDFTMINSSIQYKINESMSHLRIIDITAVSEASLDFEKKIISPAHPTLYGSNVTWNVTGYFNTDTNISYVLENVTFWVSQRNVAGQYTDPNTVDNDTISNASLITASNPNFIVNSSSPWISSNWLFNYSDIPSPIVWMDTNFTIENDGTQLINRSVTQNGNDIYIKELYLIIGYWLEINKNITSIGVDQYNIKIDVHNKGNQVTPADTVVTIYDFVPSNYNITSAIVYSASPWYNTAHANNTVNGGYNGTLHQWGLTPLSPIGLNTSFAQGPAINENTSWSATFNVTGYGDYELMDVFITGLDPQKVDGAGSSKAVVVEEILDRIKSTEGIFAAVASVLLLFGLLL